jgi:hypothetical protein
MSQPNGRISFWTVLLSAQFWVLVTRRPKYTGGRCSQAVAQAQPYFKLRGWGAAYQCRMTRDVPTWARREVIAWYQLIELEDDIRHAADLPQLQQPLGVPA